MVGLINGASSIFVVENDRYGVKDLDGEQQTVRIYTGNLVTDWFVPKTADPFKSIAKSGKIL